MGIYGFFIANWPSIVSAFGLAVGIIVGLIQLAKWRREVLDKKINTFASIERDLIRVLKYIDESDFRPELVLGLGRSGAFVGGWLAGNLGSLPIEVIDRMHEDGDEEFMSFPQVERKLELLKVYMGTVQRSFLWKVLRHVA